MILTTLQSISGGGKQFRLKNNVIPYIFGEEEKSESEPFKILGKYIPALQGIKHAEGIVISTHCTRVPVPLGHLACVSCSFKKKVEREEILEVWQNFPSPSLPSAPKRPLYYLEEKDRPQPELDVDIEGGMAVTIGRLRRCHVLDFRFTALSHNLVRGGAGGGVLTAELAYKKGYLE